MKLPVSPVFLMLALLIGWTPVAATAQVVAAGSIRGYVRDEQGGVVPGVAIAAKSPQAPTEVSTVSDTEGYYRLLNLAPGEYTVTAEVQGFSRFERQRVFVRAGLNVGLEIVLQVGAVTETVRVEQDSPLLDSSSAGQAVNVSQEFQRRVPLASRRSWSDFLELVPGMTTTSQGTEYFHLRGSNLDVHVIQVDGAPMDSGYQGGNTYVKFNTDAIQDVQVQTGGLDASAPLGVGAVINIATPTGTNRLSGSLATTHQSKSWAGDNEPGQGTTAAFSLTQVDGSGGGPLRVDRAWFFGAVRYHNRKNGISRTAERIATLRTLAPGFEPFDAANEGAYWFGKGTLQATASQQVLFSYQRDRNPRDSSGEYDAAPFLTQVSGGPAMMARLSSVWSPRFLSRLTASVTDKGFDLGPAREDVPSRTVYQSTVASGGRLSGVGLLALLDNSSVPISDPEFTKLTLAADVTWLPRVWAGTHDLKFGTFLERIRGTRTAGYFNDGFTLEDTVLRDPSNLTGGLVPFHRQIYDLDTLVAQNARSTDVALYAQDTWRPFPRVTLTLGVRADFIQQQDANFGVETQRSTELAPRMGGNYLLTEDGKNILVGSWARIFDSVLSTRQSAGSTTPGVRDLFDLDLNGSFETEFFVPGASTRATNRTFDPDFHQPYIDEWLVGYRRQLPGQATVGVSLVGREYRERIISLETNGLYENDVFLGYRDETFNEKFLTTNNVWNWPVYTSLEAVFSKQTPALQVLASYTRQWRHLEGTWWPNDPASFIQPEAFPNSRGVGATHHSSDGGYNTGSRGNSRDHAGRAGLSYNAPWGVLLGTSYIVQSGAWSGPIYTRVSAADPRFGAPTLRLSNGRLVTNPLATTTRFLYPTRTEGQLTSDTVHIWNVRGGRTFRAGGARIDLFVDVFNMLNLGQFEGFGTNQSADPTFGQRTNRQLPRTLQVQARVSF